MGNDNNLPALVEATGLAEFEGWTFEDTSKWLADVARQFGKVRLTVGLGLWVLRDRGTEEDYGTEVRKLASLMEVDEGTLRRWRSKAQAHFVLGPPAGAKARSEGQGKAKRRSSSRTVPEQLPLFDDLFTHKPAEVALLIPSAEGLALVQKLRRWVNEFETAVKGGATVPLVREPISDRPSLWPEPTVKDCKHPSNRRIDKTCMACGAKI